ncbi:putative bacteriophage protein [Burkholderia pseudomallei]|nr:putative bacteriophage protein [Burkholderia pseudomallei]
MSENNLSPAAAHTTASADRQTAADAGPLERPFSVVVGELAAVRPMVEAFIQARGGNVSGAAYAEMLSFAATIYRESLMQPAPSSADEPITIHKLWSSGGCTGFNDYLMTDYSIRTLKVSETGRDKVFPPNDGSYDVISPDNPYARTLTALKSRAVASPAADDVGNWLWSELMDYCRERGIAPATAGRLFQIVSRARAKFAPQPAQADAPAAIGRIETFSGKHGMTWLVEPSSLPEGALVYAGNADASAEAREPMNDVLFGNDESLEMAADALDRIGQDSAAAGVRAVAYELRMLAHKLRCASDAAREPIGAHNLSTSAGGRSYVAEFFAKRLRRHDFSHYINELLAADFACTLAQYLYDKDAALQPPMQAEVPAEIEPPQAGGNKGKLPALARTREGHNLYSLGYNRGLKKGRGQIKPSDAWEGLTEEQIDTLKLAIGYIGSSDRADRGDHVARLRDLLALHSGRPEPRAEVTDDDIISACDAHGIILPVEALEAATALVNHFTAGAGDAR